MLSTGQLEAFRLSQPNSIVPPPRRGPCLFSRENRSVKKVPNDLGPMPRVALAWLRGL